MRAVCPFVPHGYHPLARASHQAVAGLQAIDVSGDERAYSRLLEKLWSEGESVLVVEQDIEVNQNALLEAWECDCEWAVSPYIGPGLAELSGSLGFVRFSGRLLKRLPEVMAAANRIDDAATVAPGHWRRLDARLKGALRQADPDLRPHLHTSVLHHHCYQRAGGRTWICACLQEHEAYPIDSEGRYHSPQHVG